MGRIKILYICLLMVCFLVLSCQHDPLFEKMPGGEDNPNIPGENPSKKDIACSPDSSYFVNDVLPIINSNCALSGCHGDGSAEDGVDLTSYASIINTADIRPFRPENSDLYKAITDDDDDDRMPPAPANRLTTEQIRVFRIWIEQGAMNNSCNDCNTEQVTYSGQISPLISKNCQGCHSSPSPSGGILLSNHGQIQTQALSGKLMGAVNHSPGFTPMPYNLPMLDPCYIDQIRKWVEEGAPEN